MQNFKISVFQQIKYFVRITDTVYFTQRRNSRIYFETGFSSRSVRVPFEALIRIDKIGLEKELCD